MPATSDQMAAAQAALTTALGPQVLNITGITSAIEMIIDARLADMGVTPPTPSSNVVTFFDGTVATFFDGTPINFT